jgi:hypothetical protein
MEIHNARERIVAAALASVASGQRGNSMARAAVADAIRLVSRVMVCPLQSNIRANVSIFRFVMPGTRSSLRRLRKLVCWLGIHVFAPRRKTWLASELGLARVPPLTT